MSRKLISVIMCVMLLATAGLLATGCPVPVQDVHGAIQVEGPRNVIFFHPDGYGLSHWNALRFWLVGPDGTLNWDKLPYMAPYTGNMKDALTGSSCGGATVHAYGVKVPFFSFGMDGHEVITALSGRQMSIMEEAMEAGFATALIQTSCITHPGTAAFVSSVKEGWAEMEEIAKQVIESGVDVMLAGGERWLLPEGVTGRHGIGRRTDGVNLIERARELGYTVVYSREELMEAAADPAVTRVLGVFACGHTYNAKTEEVLRAEGLPLYWPWAPTIYEMSSATLEILARNPRAQERGMFIVAEEEGTDDFPNMANARGSFEAGRRADQALGVFADFIKDNPNTLLITTADSSAGGKDIVSAPPELMAHLLVDGKVPEIPSNSRPDGELALVPVDGIDGAATGPFLAAPDRQGNRWPFGVVWATLHDLSGGILARAKGLNAEMITELGVVDNTDIYRIMYYTLFGEWLDEPAKVEVPEAEPTTITILHTGDLHGHLDPFKPRRAEEYIGGIARIATLVSQIRAEEPNTILLDAGDTIHGTNLANLFKGEPVISAMNAIGFTAMVVGNHDFNYGLGILQERAEQADFPILGANVQYKIGEPVPFLPPYTIVEVGGLKIGIIGLVTTDTPFVTHPDNVKDLEFLDPRAVTREIVGQIAPDVDLILLVAHMGPAEEKRVLMEVPGIAVSVSGHTHEERVEQIGNTILVDSGGHGKVLGRLDIVVKAGTVIDFSHEFLSITPAIEEDASVNAVIAPYREAVGVELAEVVGVAEVVLDGEREDVRSRETNLGNLVADVIRERTGADIAIQNGGGIRASIDAGPITLEEIFTVLPFDNYIVALELTGEAIWQALENGVSDISPSGAFPQVSGMSFTFDPARPCGERIVEVAIGGEPIDLARTYIVATNCFLARGGDKYTMLKEAKVVVETGDFLRDAVAAYIRERGTVRQEVEGRIRIREVDQVELLGRAIIPADTFVAGPTSGQHIGPGPFFGRIPPFKDKQPVQGISAIVALNDDTFLAMSDNGFGAKANSPDYLLAVYKIRANFADGTVEILDMIRIRDPNREINFPIQNEGTVTRYLTGADFDIESFQVAPDGTFWIGDEFGPFLFQTDAQGVVMGPPISVPGVKSPQNPFLGEEAPTLPRSGGFEGMALGVDGTKLYPMLERALIDDDQSRRIIFEFCLRTREFTGTKFFYRVEDPNHAIGEIIAIDADRFLVIERDGKQGIEARFKKIFKIDRTGLHEDANVYKEEVVDLLRIADPLLISLPGREGDIGLGETFSFPFVTIEAVAIVAPDTLVVTNDNNFPFSTGRNPDHPDDTEIIKIRLATRL